MHKPFRPLGLAAVDYDERFLEASWHWLNEPNTRRLSQTPVFTREEQRDWFNSLTNRRDYCIWGIELKGIPIGALGLKHIENENAECWAYIGDKSLWGKGIGSWIVPEIFERAKERGLKQLSACVLEGNKRVIRLCKAYGFVETARDGVVILMKKDLRK